MIGNEKNKSDLEKLPIDSNELRELIDSIKIHFEDRQIVHKLNRILMEADFVLVNKERFETLTNREKEIISEVASGKNNPEIANCLHISRKTVEQHRKNINRKLEISNSTELNLFAFAFNLI